MNSENKRIYSRVNFDAGCQVESMGIVHECELIDISLRGALVIAKEELPLQPEQPCRLAIALEDSDIVLTFEAEVTHNTEQHVGFRFIAQDLDSFTHLRRLLEVNIGDYDTLHREFVSWSRQDES
ncbi:MAG: PilZ domain-containing protein [Gammaproteobacteria bacterium]|nr:PilZ domain-containing protein [Gammaproteobacteria bacterium]